MRKRLVVFLAILCIALAGFVIGVRMRTDREGPKITFGEEDIVYTDSTTEEELLEGVTAEDAVDGDVSDTITLESVYPMDEDTAVAVYVAKDSKNNITKVKREMKCSEEEDSSKKNKEKSSDKQKQEEQEPESTPEPTVTEELPEAEQPEEPTVSPTPGIDQEVGAEAEGTPEDSNVDREAEEARAAQEALASQMPEQSPRIYLTDYLIRIQAGESIDRLSYVKEIQDDSDNISELWHYISIDGTLDVNTPGTYELTYYVIDSNNNESNKALLKVIVE